MAVMVTLTSTVFLFPFPGNLNVLAGIGFVTVVVWNEVKLPRNVFDSITAMIEEIYSGLTALVGGILSGLSSAANTIWTSIMLIFADLRLAMIEVWPFMPRSKTLQSFWAWCSCWSMPLQ